jgi:hypothetical protein
MEQNIESQDVGAQNNPPGWEDAKSGLKVGFFLSSVYASVSMLVYYVMLFVNNLGFFQNNLNLFLSTLMLSIIVVFISALLPSAFIGAMTGLCIGTIAKSGFGRKANKNIFILTCMTSCGLIAVFIHVIFKIKIILSFEPINNSYYSLGVLESYLFLFGIPTIIYILAGGWFGWKIHSTFTKS